VHLQFLLPAVIILTVVMRVYRDSIASQVLERRGDSATVAKDKPGCSESTHCPSFRAVTHQTKAREFVQEQTKQKNSVIEKPFPGEPSPPSGSVIDYAAWSQATDRV
jgi:hypothetical protein